MKKLNILILMSILQLGYSEHTQSELVVKYPRHYLTSLYSPWVSQSIDAIVRLEIPELLCDGPKRIEDIAQYTGTDVATLERVMRLLVDIEVFEESSPGIFKHNAVSQFLVKDHPQSLARFSLFFEPHFHKIWPHLLDSLITGKSASNLTYGSDTYEEIQKHPELLEKVKQYISGRTTQVTKEILAAYDFSAFNTIVDVGGNTGYFVKSIQKLYPNIEGIILDLPETVSLAEKKEEEKITYVGGDFFHKVPEGGDLYILQSILHDWTDEQALAILTECKKAMPKGSKLLVIEMCIEKDAWRKNTVKIEDVKLQALTGGAERSESEYYALLEQCGFLEVKKFETQSDYTLLEATL